MKIVSAQIPHKAKVGGVRLGLGSAVAVEVAFREMMREVSGHVPDARIEGVLVSEMVDIQTELIVGAYVDEHLGPALLVGMGGGQVEALRDVALCLLPATKGDCTRLLDDLSDPRVRLLGSAEKKRLAEVIGPTTRHRPPDWRTKTRALQFRKH